MSDWGEIHADAKTVYEYRLAQIELKVDVLQKKYEEITTNTNRILVSVIVSGITVFLTVVVTHIMTVSATTGGFK